MTDLNIVADGNLARLLSLEAERAGLSYKISHRPTGGARVYVVDSDFFDVETFSPSNTIVIGEAEGFEHRLSNPFLLTDFRAVLSKLLSSSHSEKAALITPKKKRNLSIAADKNSHSAVVYGKRTSLSPTEFALFEALIARRGEILSYEEANRVLDCDGSNKVNVYICFLRKKLETGGEKIIYSIRGKGFLIK